MKESVEESSVQSPRGDGSGKAGATKAQRTPGSPGKGPGEEEHPTFDALKVDSSVESRPRAGGKALPHSNSAESLASKASKPGKHRGFGPRIPPRAPRDHVAIDGEALGEDAAEALA